MDHGHRVISEEKKGATLFENPSCRSRGETGGSSGKVGLPPNMRFNQQKSYNDPAQMFPGESIFFYILKEVVMKNVPIRVLFSIFVTGMSKMFGGIQGIMASDIQSRHSMIRSTIREKNGREAGIEENTNLMTSCNTGHTQ